MKFIIQSPLEVYGLAQAHASPPNTSEQATSRWSSFGHKDTVLRCLLRQQYQLCCYSEVRADLLGISHHIEHVENKNQNPSRTFDETNLAASALSTDDIPRLQKADVFGGHALGKRTAVDLAQFVSCFSPDCASYFHYLSDGRVVPGIQLLESERIRAQYTIDLLNLNSNYLKNLRMDWWTELERLEQEHIRDDWDLYQLIQLDLVPTQHNQLTQFFSLTRQFFGPLAEEVLNTYAPQLV
ncbi:TIGR02646 family protein [Phytobacter diazotrophicus]|uniref:retron system putative HNH endonuclease n=1 Tax=Phytobacter diazotrophicus TaxID=395631 RepID=UPI00232D7925|nr:retron system putative HNH endonuclease [Phytobacter diazotrophicus]MDC0726921.1 TIGR02646 family protein [Phytobacter diazotrophicus]MDC0734384.1 TIGR02646 family protein [Phytobacter diazotrophicus]